MKNHYKTLGITRKSTDEEIKAALRAIAVRNHPDKHAGDAEKAATMTAANEAYAVMKSRIERGLYERQIALMYPACPKCEGTGVYTRQHGFLRRIVADCHTCAGAGYMISE